MIVFATPMALDGSIVRQRGSQAVYGAAENDLKRDGRRRNCYSTFIGRNVAWISICLGGRL